MESEDDYESFSPLEGSSPQPQNKFKRLKKKKATDVGGNSSPSPVSIDPLIGLPRVDFAQLKALEAAATKTLNSHLDDYSNESLPSQIETQMESSDGNDSLDNMEFDGEVPFEEDRKETKRALEFDGVADIEMEGSFGRLEKKRTSEEGLCDKKDEEKGEDIANKKKKNKRIKSDDFSNEMKSKPSASDKRRQEKERKASLNQLHAESQRLLRETREAAFKPIPVVNKPISSVLEKIRQRKLQLSKRNVLQNGNAFVTERSGAIRDDMMGFESRSRLMEQKKEELAKPVEKDSVADPENFVGRDALDMDKFGESPSPSSNENIHREKSLTEASPPMFRAPINDTEDLFANSETQDGIDDLSCDPQDSPSEEVPEPSLLAMNLKFDSALYEDSSSEEDNDKENIDPLPHRAENNSTIPRGAPAEAFLDDEAEEEDDSDNDLMYSKENEEEEDMEDSEELNDIIATDYTEKPVDSDRRNELHQMWLQQQDAAGTNNLLQKLKIGSKAKEDVFLGEEQEVDEDRDDYNHEEVAPKNSARMNSKRAKELITQMFVDKDDLFLSDEDEEIEKIRVKQHLLIRAEEQATVVSPMEDESSREVFGLVKKLNIMPENKKKVKASSYFDSVLSGGNSKSFSKPSFLGRLSNHHLPSSHKQGSGVVRSFIFGRDDSNSRSSISMPDDSSDTISKENQPIRTSAATVTSSQAKFKSQYRNTSAVEASGASLFEILKRASIQSVNCNDGDPVDLSHVLATFKVPKKQIKVDGRN